jgi:hypothetical protein
MSNVKPHYRARMPMLELDPFGGIRRTDSSRTDVEECLGGLITPAERVLWALRYIINNYGSGSPFWRRSIPWGRYGD